MHDITRYLTIFTISNGIAKTPRDNLCGILCGANNSCRTPRIASQFSKLGYISIYKKLCCGRAFCFVILFTGPHFCGIIDLLDFDERSLLVKRIFVLLLASAIFVTLASCGHEVALEDIKDPHFTGRVLEKIDTSSLLEITDSGNQGLPPGEKIIVRTAIDDCPAFEEGDHLTVVFDGTMALSYPAQVLRVYAIYKTDANGTYYMD